MDRWTCMVDYNQLYFKYISCISVIFIHSRSNTWFLLLIPAIYTSRIHSQICSFLLFTWRKVFCFLFMFEIFIIFENRGMKFWGFCLPQFLLNIFSYRFFVIMLNFICGIRFFFQHRKFCMSDFRSLTNIWERWHILITHKQT